MIQGTFPSTRAGGYLLGLVLASGATAASPPLIGKWAGDRVSMTFDTQGATIISDCARGRIAIPIRPDRRGDFTAIGTFDVDKPGPQRADETIKAQTARFSGQLRGTTIDLSIDRGDGSPIQHATLDRGASMKFVRCL